MSPTSTVETSEVMPVHQALSTLPTIDRTTNQEVSCLLPQRLLSVRETCNVKPEQNVMFLRKMQFRKAVQLCRAFGGSLALPTNIVEEEVSQWSKDIISNRVSRHLSLFNNVAKDRNHLIRMYSCRQKEIYLSFIYF